MDDCSDAMVKGEFQRAMNWGAGKQRGKWGDGANQGLTHLGKIRKTGRVMQSSYHVSTTESDGQGGIWSGWKQSGVHTKRVVMQSR